MDDDLDGALAAARQELRQELLGHLEALAEVAP